ncbi:MAG TPA: cation:proton antiporter [Ramlibacter sp.]|nr:cation:proton antiporter [Ramlibacter sp.]
MTSAPVPVHAASILLAMAVVFAIPYAVWRMARTEYVAPLLVVQILTGLALGPGMLGNLSPALYATLFPAPVLQVLGGLALWGVVLFIWMAGIELDLRQAWGFRFESGITAGLCLGVPLLFGCAVGLLMALGPGWAGSGASQWQFVLGIGMACAVTALPVLILVLEKLDLLQHPIGQRVLRYASLDDVAIWVVLAAILLDWEALGRQALFLAGFGLAATVVRATLPRLREADRWYLGLVLLIASALAAEWAGLHYMVGAFLAGVIVDKAWLGAAQLHQLRQAVLLVLMPIYLLMTGLRTQWGLGQPAVLVAAAGLVLAAVGGKLLACRLAGKLLGWSAKEASVIGWLLQTKGLVEIVFATILLDRRIISAETFTALLLMAVVSTTLAIPLVRRRLGADGYAIRAKKST